MPEPKVICIGGSPSSGTTLLADLMDAVPGIACGPELNIFCLAEAYDYAEEFREHAAQSASFHTGACYAPRSRFFNRKHLHQVGLDDEKLRRMIVDADSLRAFAEEFRRHFSAFRGRDIRILAEKTPINVNQAGRFLQQFPDGLFIHLVRDPRSVVASLLRRGYCLWEATLIWIAQTYTGLQFESHPHVLTLKYEDLIARPFETIAQAVRRADMAVDPKEIERRYKESGFRSELDRVASWSSAGQTATAIHKPPEYRSQLSPAQIDFIESAALRSNRFTVGLISVRTLTAHLGYDLDHDVPSTSPAAIIEEHQRYAHSVSRPDGQCDLHLYLTDTSFDPADRQLRQNRISRRRGMIASEGWLLAGPSDAVTQWLALPRAVAGSPVANDFAIAKRLSLLLRKYGVILPARPGTPSIERLPLRSDAIAKACSRYRESSYAWRPLRNTDAGKDDRPQLPQLISDLIDTYLYIYRRKLDAGRTIRPDDLLTLLLACREASRNSKLQERADALYRQALESETANEIDPQLAQSIIDRKPLSAHSGVSRHMKCLHESLLESDESVAVPSYANPLRESLVEIVAAHDPPSLHKRLASLLENHYDPQLAMLTHHKPDASITGGSSRRPLVSALVPLALIVAARRLDLPLQAPRAHFPRPAPLNREKWQPKHLLKHVMRLQQPPNMGRPLAPRCPDGYLAALESELVRGATSVQLDRQGWVVLLSETPPDAPYVASLRYDVDRPLTEDQVDRILQLDRRLDCHSSVYVRPETFDAALIARLRDAGCEIGCHLAGRERTDDEFLNRLADFLEQPVGVTFHGGVGSEYWLGRETLLHYARRSAHYAEMLHEWTPHPSLFQIEKCDIMTTPLSVKVDAYPEWVEQQMQLVRQYRGHAILEQHPDHIDELWFEMMLRCRDEGASLRTVVEHVNICRAIERASVQAHVTEGGMEITINCDEPITAMVRVNRQFFRPDESYKPLPRQRSPGMPGIWYLPPRSEPVHDIRLSFCQP